MNDPIEALVIRLYRLGRTPAQISKRVAKNEAWVQQVIMTIPPLEAIPEQDDNPIIDEETEIWSEEWINYAVERLTPKGFRVLEQVMDSPTASESSKLKAAELLFRYQPKMKEAAPVNEEKTTRVQLDAQTLRILEQIAKEEMG